MSFILSMANLFKHYCKIIKTSNMFIIEVLTKNNYSFLFIQFHENDFLSMVSEAFSTEGS